MADQQVKKFIPKETKTIKYYSTTKGDTIIHHYAKVKFNIKLNKKDERSIEKIMITFAKYLLKKARADEKKEYNIDISGTMVICCNMFLKDIYDIMLTDYNVKIVSYHITFNDDTELVATDKENTFTTENAVLEIVLERVEA